MLFVRLLLLTLIFPIATTVAADSQPDSPHGRKVLALLGAKMEDSSSPKALASYEAIFKRLDSSGEGELSTKEFVEDGTYLTRQARQGIFRASDNDADGFVTKDEYVLNRVITDEAKRIFTAIDKNQDGRLVQEEFVTHARIDDSALASQVFKGFDLDADGRLVIPEYLRVWGQWARESPVTGRLVVNTDTYVLPKERQSDDFRKRINEETDSQKLPASPKIDLVLELHNTGTDPVMIWPRGTIDEPELAITGPGVVTPDNLKSISAGVWATTPQPVILPGKKYRISIESLNPSGFSHNAVYWTKPGEYTITASYPVWKNLPPHPPGLLSSPAPKGPPIKFSAKTPPVKIKVVAGE
jgi:Ca2+-binding EF-hand superfamily protein